MNEDRKFEELLKVFDQLKPKARRDVLDMAVYIVWKQTGKPASWHTIIRGGWLHAIFKVRKFFGTLEWGKLL